MSEDMENDLEWYKGFLEIVDKNECIDKLPENKPHIEKIKDYVLLLEFLKGEEERLLKKLNLSSEDAARAREYIKKMLTWREKIKKEAMNNTN